MPQSINYFFPFYRQDQQAPFNVTGVEVGPKAIWEATGLNNEHAGTFVPRLNSATSYFTPYNRTQEVKVRFYNAISPTWSTEHAAQLVFDTVNDEVRYENYGGSVGPYYGATGAEFCPAGDCFVESVVDGNAYNRGFGLSRPPHSYGWDAAGFDYSIAFGQLNSASFWAHGAPVVGAYADIPGISYKTGDIFRVEVRGSKVNYCQNGKVIYQYTPKPTDPPLTNLYPLVSFYIEQTKIAKVRFWQTSYGKAEATLWVTGVLPVCQDKASEHEVTEIAEVSEAESQRGRDKIVRYHRQQDKWDLFFSGRRLSELQLLRDFRAFHRVHLPFYIADQARGLDQLVVFETGIKDRLVQQNMFDFSCTVKEY